MDQWHVDGCTVPDGIRLRYANADDPVRLTAVEREAMCSQLAHVFPPAEYPFPSGIVQQRWAEEVVDASFRIVVAERDGEVVGYCSCQGEWLHHIGVAPEAMGQGLATLLITEARRASGLPMFLWVIDRNHRARRFYEREGWTLTDDTRTEPFPPFPTSVRYVAPALVGNPHPDS